MSSDDISRCQNTNSDILMFSKYSFIAVICMILQSSFAYKPYMSPISRRNFLAVSGCTLYCALSPLSPLSPLRVSAEEQKEDNPPLTPAEMEEYKRLLSEAQRIKSIIDANMKAAERELEHQKKEFDEIKKLRK